MEERRKTKANKQKCVELNKQVKKRCNKAEEHWTNTQCEKIEDNDVTNSKIMHQKIREVTNGKVSAKIGCLRSRDGDILMEKKDTLYRWSEYITELYRDGRGPPPIISNEDEGRHILVS
ncbi:craniofacial development protein 2-like [Elysia marginata]|uniref:Craniofacial development protein 2-like n=1 Tax=Elysia marginata TaxID=1093978 RepID=A0AAV4G244_9GAST|nr:craniofacial development protein 2-like [Elysia marginata]